MVDGVEIPAQGAAANSSEASTEASAEERVRELERTVAAQRKTIDVLAARVERYQANGDDALEILERNVALEMVVEMRSDQLRVQKIALDQALAELAAVGRRDAGAG